MINKTRAHLPALGEGRYGDPEDDTDTGVTIDRKIWAGMGRPATVTVTIEPGDQIKQCPACDTPERWHARLAPASCSLRGTDVG